MTSRSYSHKDFLQSYEFLLHPLEDFTLNRTPASHAPQHPREWGQEKDGFDFWKDFQKTFGSNLPKGDGESVSSVAIFIREDQAN